MPAYKRDASKELSDNHARLFEKHLKEFGTAGMRKPSKISYEFSCVGEEPCWRLGHH